MITFKKHFLLLILFFSFIAFQITHAQNYIDIDLSPPKPKQPPTQKKPPTPKATPAKKITKQPKTTAKPPAKQVAKPKQAPVKPAPKTAPADDMNLDSEPPTQATKPAAPAVALPTPKISAPKLKATKKATKEKAKPKKTEELKLDNETPTTPVAKPTTPTPTPAAPPPPIPTPEPLSSESDLNLQDTPNPIATPSESGRKTRTAYVPTEDDEPRFKSRHAFTLDYTTWYESMKMTARSTKTLLESNSHYFGVAFSYDYTVYREKFGYAFSVGGVTGNAQAGTKDSGDYYERRIVWTGYRAGGRLFFRANNRIDLGLGFLAQTKTTQWPNEEAFTVLPQSNPQYFYYLDTRWRLNYRYELVQGFGTHLRSYALAWMLGINYTLN